MKTQEIFSECERTGTAVLITRVKAGGGGWSCVIGDMRSAHTGFFDSFDEAVSVAWAAHLQRAA